MQHDTKLANLMQLPNIVAWLETKPANEEYEYSSNHHCMVAQYLHENGFQHVMVVPGTIFLSDSHKSIMHRYPYIYETILHNPGDDTETFGKALQRAKTLLLEDCC